jgi:hypothetical protein
MTLKASIHAGFRGFSGATKEGFRCFGKRSNLRLSNTTFHCLQINNNLWLAAFGRKPPHHAEKKRQANRYELV